MATNLPAGVTFTWYLVAAIEDIESLVVPQFFKTSTIENLPAEIWYTETFDFSGELRSQITVSYNGIYLPLNIYGFSPYYKSGYAVEQFEGNLYLGIEAAA